MKNLRRLAALYGVLHDYHGVHGLSRARPDALLAALAILGAPVARPQDVEPALRHRIEERRKRLLPPVAVAWDDRPPVIPLPSSPSGRAEMTLVLEDGSVLERFVELDGRHLTLPERPPHGYHRIALKFGSAYGESLLVAAPRRSYRRDGDLRWGLFAPLYATWTRESRGCGDFSDLVRLIETTAGYRGGFVATLPLLSTFVDDPSPYSPVSRCFWNELYVDPRRTPEWDEGDREGDGLAVEELVDYRALEVKKRPLVEKMARRALSRRPLALAQSARAHPDVLSYARFRARKEDGRAREEGDPSPDFGDDRVLYHLYGQMAAEEQLSLAAARASASDVLLYFDLPLGVHRSGFDVASRADLFAHRADVGAPPDAVFPDGQNWGFPPLLPERSRAEGHLYLRRTLDAAMRHADVLRVDHVMGLNRQFWIPSGFEKRDGVYVRYPAEELYAVFNLESHRHRCELVGEDLGIVPPAVDESLARHGWRGIYVLQFRLTGRRSEPAAPIPKETVASFNTHDTPTFAGFCRGRDVAERVEAGVLDRETAERLGKDRAEAIEALDRALGASSEGLSHRLERWLSLLLASDADLVSITLEDLWLEEAPQNVPGRIDLPNWRRRLRYSLDGLPEEVISKLGAIRPRTAT